MKVFVLLVTTKDKWEFNPSVYTVTAESKEEAIALFKMDPYEKEIEEIHEVDLSVKGQTKFLGFGIE